MKKSEQIWPAPTGIWTLDPEQNMLYSGKSQEDMLTCFGLIDGKINPSDREQPLNCIGPGPLNVP